jgi:hypothetical protein
VRGRQAGAHLLTVPVSRPGTRPGAAPVRLPLMARAGVPRGTSPGVVRRRRRARVTRPAVRHARPPETGHAGPAGLRPAARPGTAGPRRAASIGPAALPRVARPATAGPLRAASPGPAVPRPVASIAVVPGLRTRAGFVHPRVARPAKAPVAGLHRAAGLAVHRREASAATLRRVATSAAPGGQPTPGHGGPPRVTPGDARGPRAKERPRVTAAVTGHHGQPPAGPVTAARATAGQAPVTRHGPAAGARTTARPAVLPRPMRPGCTFPTRSAPTSSTRKRGRS